MRARPRSRRRSARTNLDDVRDPVPFAIKLADLLLIYLEPKRDLMIVLGADPLRNFDIFSVALNGVEA